MNTAAAEARARVLSDGVLLERAAGFAGQHRVPPTQINGLLNYSRGGWEELDRFVGHQAARNWPQVNDQEHPIQRFYWELKKELDWLKALSLKEGFVPDGLTKREHHEALKRAAARLAREYVQHLWAEMLYRSQLGRELGDDADV